MILLQPTDFTGLFRSDQNPALAQDFNDLVAQVERKILRYMFGISLASWIEANQLSNFANEVRNSTRFLYYSYLDFTRDYVLNYYYTTGLRGAINDKEVYLRIGSVNGAGALYAAVRYLHIMKMWWMRSFITDALGNIVVLEEPYFRSTFAILYPFHYDIGFVFTDGTNTYTISAVTPAATAYTYSFTPVPPPGTSLQITQDFWIMPPSPLETTF